MTPTEPDQTAAPSRLDLRWIVALLTLAGLGLRLWGITWGLPNREHLYSYHPDEILILQASYMADLWSGQLNPHFYNYGSLTIYLNSLLRPLASALIAPGLYTDYLLGRTLTALFGAGTIPLAYGLARQIGGMRAGFLAASLLAFAPAHVLHSHYLTVDVPAAFWVTLALYASLRAMRGEGERWTWLAGAAAGLAAGTKYNAGVVVLAVLLAHLPRRSGLWKAQLAAALAFLLSTPGVLLWTAQFWRDFSYEVAHTAVGHGWVFVGTPPAWIFHWTKNLRWGLGLPLLILTSVSLLTALLHLWRWQRGRRRATEAADSSGITIHPYLVLLAFALPYYLIIGQAEVKFLRYTIPLIPVFLVILGAEAARWWHGRPPSEAVGEEARTGSAPAWQPGLRAALLGLGAGIGLYTLLYTLAFTQLLSRVPPQDQAADWLRRHAAGQTVALTTAPWFYSPPVSPYNAGPQSERGFREHLGEAPYRLLVVGMDPERLAAADPDYLVLSEFETGDIERLAGQEDVPNREALRESVRFLERVQEGYTPAFRAENRPRMLPPALLPGDEPPHDWLYPYPAVTIWRNEGDGR